MSPTDAADWHPARPAADILGNLRRFGIGHNDIVAADAVRGDGDNVPAYSQTSVTSPFFAWRGPTFMHQMQGGGPVFPRNASLDLTPDQVVFKANILVGPIGH